MNHMEHAAALGGQSVLQRPQPPVSRAQHRPTGETPAIYRASHANSVEHPQSAPSVHLGQGGKGSNLGIWPKSSTKPCQAVSLCHKLCTAGEHLYGLEAFCQVGVR